MVLIQPCSTTAAYEAIPERDLRLDMPRLRDQLEAHGWRTLADAGIMLVIQKGADDASIFRSGKILVKTRDPAVAQRVWNELNTLYPL